jgi:hypothetical protein
MFGRVWQYIPTSGYDRQLTTREMTTMAHVYWTAEERQAITNQAIKVRRAGKIKTLTGIIAAAQRVLPKARRRDIDTIAKAAWLGPILKGPLEALEAPGTPDQESQGMEPAATSEKAAKTPKHIYWTRDEKAAIANKAGQLLVSLEASGPRDALLKAQKLVLPANRQRDIAAMTMVKDWFPDALQQARVVAQRERDEAIIKAQAEAAAAAAAPAAEPAAPAAEPDQAPTAAPVAALAPSPIAGPVASIFNSSMWLNLRSQLVNEIAGIVSEGVLRGLEAVKLGGAQPAQAPQGVSEESTMRPHVPFVRESRPPKNPSVLVVGLKGGQVPLIEADFGAKLDLRFCGAHESKDQLRSMVDKADTTVAFVDFLSHSHTDIIKARTHHYVESHGGMTSLREKLAQLAVNGAHMNGATPI